MIFQQASHRRLQNGTQFQFKGLAQFLQYIPEMPGNAPHKVDRGIPGFGVFVQMHKEEITQPVFNDILDHEMATVFA
jgi:hypothetical protein